MDWMSDRGNRQNSRIFRIFAGIALGLQAAAVLLTVYICMDQRRIKQLFSAQGELLDIYSIPADYVIVNLGPVVVYLLFFVFLLVSANKETGSRAGAGIFFGFSCLLKILLEYVPQFSAAFWNTMDTASLASHMVLGNAITMASRPLTLTAFGFFQARCP